MTYPITITREQAAAPALFWSTFWDEAEQLGDWRVAPAADPVNPGGLDASEQLASAVIISLFTDKRAPEGWRPDVADRRGWWGDGVAAEGEVAEAIGSHLWLLRNEVATEEIAELARIYAEEALAWLTRDKVAASVSVTSGLIETPRRGVWLDVKITGRDGALAYDRRFARLWSEI
ncbi:putative bacteriophage protein, GP46-like protein [Bosea sp. LC85]|uniref:phage GP46 family protein n=1 Tax=Bosea sp. LC85 TaxID=1502851 RepID=UPI0004E3E4B6|nr:phage GP46 family protein [Bosea sp. LC85]KFC63971.1 putative bacteriophage protein, GP46-like protein [Bosea sp. LC85]